MKRKSIGRQSVPGGNSYPIGSGYVTIPSDISRNKFIIDCYSTSSIMVRGEYGDMYKRVSIDKTSLKEVDFPLKSGELGSAVVWLQMPKHNTPVVIAVFDKKGERNSVIEEGQYRVNKTSDSGNVDIDLRSSSPYISLSVLSKVSGKGKISLKVINPDETALIDLFVKGVFKLIATKQIQLTSSKEFIFDVVDSKGVQKGLISYKLGTGFTFVDEFGNKFTTVSTGVLIEDKNGNKINSNSSGIDLFPKSGGKVNTGGSSEPMILGDTLNANLNTLIDSLNNLNKALTKYTVTQGTIAVGALAPLASGYTVLGSSISQIVLDLTNLKTNLSKNLSKKSMTE